MKKKSEWFTWTLAIILLLLVALSIICMVHSECFSPNQASILGGVLGAIATGLLGGIAFWQNKRYKELSDELMERAYMPELYKADVFTEQFQDIGQSVYNKISFEVGQNGGEPTQTIYCKEFRVLNPPILNITVKSIKCAGRRLLLQGTPHSLYKDESAFSLSLTIPQRYIKKGEEFEVAFIYENIYGTQYEKIVFFTLQGESTTAIKWKMNRARRIN